MQEFAEISYTNMTHVQIVHSRSQVDKEMKVNGWILLKQLQDICPEPVERVKCDVHIG